MPRGEDNGEYLFSWGVFYRLDEQLPARAPILAGSCAIHCGA